MKKMTQKELFELISEYEKDYCNLVWYARKSDSMIKEYGLEDSIAAVEEQFPHETQALKSPDTGDWQHGFHSGILAAMRYIQTAKELGKAQADEWFPELDS